MPQRSPLNFSPFNNGSQSVGITTNAGELTLENQGQQVNLYGNATFTLDQDSLELAKQLQQVMADIVAYLEQHGATEQSHQTIVNTQQNNVSEVANPFV
ncbi:MULTISPECIES: hypothetical protein [unclassified Moraxella]|uniref:hypothetical protein n=1 Tax=unclassified Moraxella TaxID=2685852 RepID=UPI003AF9A56B